MPSLRGLNLKLTKVMDSWTQQIGYPYVHLTLENNQFRFQQMRFLYLSSEREKAARFEFSAMSNFLVSFNVSQLFEVQFILVYSTISDDRSE